MNIVAKYYFSRTEPGEPHVVELWLTGLSYRGPWSQHTYSARHILNDESHTIEGCSWSNEGVVPSYADVYHHLPKDDRGAIALPGGAA